MGATGLERSVDNEAPTTNAPADFPQDDRTPRGSGIILSIAY